MMNSGGYGLLNFEKVGKQGLGKVDPLSKSPLDNLNNVNIPDELPDVPLSLLKNLDEATQTYLIQALDELRKRLPTFPPRPPLNISEVENQYKQDATQIIGQCVNSINRHNYEEQVKDALNEASHDIIRRREVAIVPPFSTLPPPPPPPPLAWPYYYYHPYYPPPPPSYPPATQSYPPATQPPAATSSPSPLE